MRRRNKTDQGAVAVHVTPRGGLYVDTAELLRSEAAREVMSKMDRILQEDTHGQQAARTSRPNTPIPSRER